MPAEKIGLSVRDRSVLAQKVTRFVGEPVVAVAADNKEIAEEALDYLDAPILRVGAPFTPNPYSKPLEDNYLPSSKDIVSAVKKIVN